MCYVLRVASRRGLGCCFFLFSFEEGLSNKKRHSKCNSEPTRNNCIQKYCVISHMRNKASLIKIALCLSARAIATRLSSMYVRECTGAELLFFSFSRKAVRSEKENPLLPPIGDHIVSHIQNLVN